MTELGESLPSGLGRRGLCDLAAASARLRAALDAFDARVASSMTKLDDGGPTASAMIRSSSRCTQREADRRTRRAEVLSEMPVAAKALADGAISAEHVDSLAHAAERTSIAAVADSGLLDIAKARPADVMAKDVRAWTRREISTQNLEDEAKRQLAARRSMMFDNDTGMAVLHTEFDQVTGAEVRSAVDTLTNRLYQQDGGRDGACEARTPEQRRADAVAAALIGAARGSVDTRGVQQPPAVRNQMVVVAHADGTAEIPDVGPIPQSELERLACISDLFGIVFNTDGKPLWLGRRQRLASDDQWRALIARDGGCVICNAAASRCEAHHVIFWEGSQRGPTDIDNLVLLCKHHHHLVHDHNQILTRDSHGNWVIRAAGPQLNRRLASEHPGFHPCPDASGGNSEWPHRDRQRPVEISRDR
ncbi:MAG: DUF222 domain-containing protein [bacterium]|nr:DUF222 domain-containing protein [bacterium]